MTRALLLCALLAACSDESYLVVTVTNRPAVHDATTLRVTLANAGSERTDELAVSAFPVTFSISAPDRSGDLDITVEAEDQNDLVVGRGAARTRIDADTAEVQLDTTDFVVNTEVAGDQYPDDDYEAHGLQLASGADGTWTATFRDNTGTNLFARRFDAAGRPVPTQAAASDQAFVINSIPTTGASVPAIATAGDVTLALWDYAEQPVGVDGIACRSINAMGQLSANQVSLALDNTADVVAITPLSNKNFAATWSMFGTTNVIRGVIIRPDCTVLNPAVNVSTLGSPRRPHVASVGTTLLYAWRLDGSVHVRLSSLTNAFTTVDTSFLPATTTESVEAVRVAPLGTGYAILVRWALTVGATGPGRIELYRTNEMGAILGQPTLVTSRSGSDFQSSESFGVASRADGTIFVTWHACLENGDQQGCGVFGQALDMTGALKGEMITIPTTTSGDQTNPSTAAVGTDAFAVIWRDDSAQQPDAAGAAVRGRIVYVP